jgi:hypothetical protein
LRDELTIQQKRKRERDERIFSFSFVFLLLLLSFSVYTSDACILFFIFENAHQRERGEPAMGRRRLSFSRSVRVLCVCA